jgi:hypothetical protein
VVPIGPGNKRQKSKDKDTLFFPFSDKHNLTFLEDLLSFDVKYVVVKHHGCVAFEPFVLTCHFVSDTLRSSMLDISLRPLSTVVEASLSRNSSYEGRVTLPSSHPRSSSSSSFVRSRILDHGSLDVFR